MLQNQPTPEELEAQESETKQVRAAEMQKANAVNKKLLNPRAIDLQEIQRLLASY